MKEFSLKFPGEIVFGYGSIGRSGKIFSSAGRRFLVVADAVLDEQVSYLESILARAGIDALFFNEIGPNSTSLAVDQAVSLGRAGKVEGVIGFGGFRTLSTARAVAAVIEREGGIDNFWDNDNQEPVKSKSLPYIEIPTVFRHPFMLNDKFMLTDSRTRETGVFRNPGGIPRAVIIDPALTETLSDKYTAAILLGTFLHALEGYISLGSSFFSDTLFLRAMGNIVDVHKALRSNPGNKDLREKASQAGFLTAMGLTMGNLGIGSLAAFIISGKYKIPKSIVSTIMLPHILQYGASVCPEKICRIAPILGIDIKSIPRDEAANSVIRTVRNRISVYELPLRLHEYNIGTGDIDDIVNMVSDFHMDLPSALSSAELKDLLLGLSDNVITVKKLLTLKPGTRRRKIILLLNEFEKISTEGKIPDSSYCLDVVRIISGENISGQITAIADSELIILEKAFSERDTGNILRSCNRLRHELQKSLGAEPADWDFVSPDSGKLDPSLRKILPYRVYLDDIRSPFNVGSIFRTSDAFGVEKNLLSPYVPSPDHKRAKRTSMGCTDLIPWEVADIKQLSGEENVFALEVGGTPVDRFDFPEKGIVILGSEELGVSPEALAVADKSKGRVSIPSVGVKGSINVGVAFGILMHSWFSFNSNK